MTTNSSTKTATPRPSLLRQVLLITAPPGEMGEDSADAADSRTAQETASGKGWPS
jgi:hypothetical protein